MTISKPFLKSTRCPVCNCTVMVRNNAKVPARLLKALALARAIESNALRATYQEAKRVLDISRAKGGTS